jgi:membrane peptidoglycan carboxypeptidase
VRLLGFLPRLLAVIAGGALLVTAVVVGVAPRVWSVANSHEELPVELPEFEALAQRSYVYDANGQEIAIYELENSQPIPFAQIPEHVVQAFLVVEDKEFFSHEGINVRSLVRATLSNFASEAPQQGASTITMQVVKNDYLAGLERDGRYKLLQIHYARMLEKERSKEEILERYLNTVFFGNNAYGIEAAAETYFAKGAAELTFVEAAFLAGLVRSPSGFDPINEPERSRARWLQIVDRLESERLVTPIQAFGLQNFVLPSRVRTLPTRSHQRTYFTEALRDYLLNMTDILGDTYEQRYNRLFRGGLRIHTTLDANLQGMAEQARNVLPDTFEGFDAAIVSLDSTTAAIRVMVGGRGFKVDENEVNMALSPRQTGSSIKLFILAAAVQAGAQANDLIDGTDPCTLPNPEDPAQPFPIDAVSGGLSTLQSMTTRSINCAYARLSQIVGLHRVVDTTYRMARSPYLYAGQPESEREPLQPYASFATGANEMSPLDMAAGVQTLANEGVHLEPYMVEYIDDAAGQRVFTHVDAGTQVFDRDVALESVQILKGPIYGGGTGRRAAFDDQRPAFGKTGTQQDNTNAWFIGGTRQLSTAVWVGDPNGYTDMENIPQFTAAGYGDTVQGGHFPAVIWNAFMEPAHAGVPHADWERPAPPSRPNMRLYLPGNECALRVVGFQEVAPTTDPNAPTTTAAAPTTTVAGAPPPPTTAPPPPVTIPLVESVQVGTTIPPDVLDPLAPLPTLPLTDSVGTCQRGARPYVEQTATRSAEE